MTDPQTGGATGAATGSGATNGGTTSGAASAATGGGAAPTQAEQIILNKQVKARTRLIEELQALHESLRPAWDSAHKIQDGLVVGQCVAINAIVHTMISQQVHILGEIKKAQQPHNNTGGGATPENDKKESPIILTDAPR